MDEVGRGLRRIATVVLLPAGVVVALVLVVALAVALHVRALAIGLWLLIRPIFARRASPKVGESLPGPHFVDRVTSPRSKQVQ